VDIYSVRGLMREQLEIVDKFFLADKILFGN